MTNQDLYIKVKNAVGRKLRQHEYIQLARLSKKYGLLTVYDAFNFIDCHNGWFYVQLLKYLETQLVPNIGDIDINDLIKSKKKGNPE